MKKLFFLVVFFLLIEGVYSQQRAAVANMYIKRLFVGVDNLLTISVAGISNNNISVEISDGIIRKIKGNEYIATFLDTGFVEIKIYTGSKYIGSDIFYVAELKTVMCDVNGKAGGNISLSEIIDAKKLTIGLTDIFDYELQILGFNLGYIKAGMSDDFFSNSENFTDEQLDALKSLDVGDKFYIDNITVKTINGKIINAKSLSFRLISL